MELDFIVFDWDGYLIKDELLDNIKDKVGMEETVGKTINMDVEKSNFRKYIRYMKNKWLRMYYKKPRFLDIFFRTERLDV